MRNPGVLEVTKAIQSSPKGICINYQVEDDPNVKGVSFGTPNNRKEKISVAVGTDLPAALIHLFTHSKVNVDVSLLRTDFLEVF